MLHHYDISSHSFRRSRCLYVLIRTGQVTLAGNSRLKIYGCLDCSSGKRMKIENRVFFKDEEEALAHSYRPCGHCMKKAYEVWRGAQRSKR
ncbi:Ada metal-binding domain-containing protein [Fulvivirga imtechensis]|nr:Ada metal-binding domain-containing protein [Fulvivirga imtechensis]